MSAEEVEVVREGGGGPVEEGGSPLGDAARRDVERRVLVDLPRVRPEEMVTSQPAEPAPDPYGGRDTETEFLLRHAGW